MKSFCSGINVSYSMILHIIGGFHVASSPPCWWTKTTDLSLALFVRPPAFCSLSSVSLEIGCKPPIREGILLITRKYYATRKVSAGIICKTIEKYIFIFIFILFCFVFNHILDFVIIFFGTYK